MLMLLTESPLTDSRYKSATELNTAVLVQALISRNTITLEKNDEKALYRFIAK